MKVTLTATDKVVTLVFPEGWQVPARVWEGQTITGLPCYAYITRLGVQREQDLGQFERELVDQQPPSTPAVAALPRRHRITWKDGE